MVTLTVTGLTVDVPGHRLVHGIDLTATKGRVLALIGPSGSGKTLTARAIAGLQPFTGTVHLDGRPIRRGRDVGYAFQDALASLNPVITIGKHLAETVRAHRTGDPHAALTRYGLDPALATAYPFELSGGQAQRAALALATVHEPAVLIADEVTTALDPITQQIVLDLLRAQAQDRAIVLITHDLAAAARWADDIAVIHHGRIIEHGTASDVLTRPKAELTRELIDASALTTTHPAPAERSGTRLTCKALTRTLHGRDRTTIAVTGIDLEIGAGESVAIVGRSGSGKSTLTGALATLDRPDSGTLHHDDHDAWALTDRERRTLRRRTGLIFQHPGASFDPRHTVGQVIAEAGPYDDGLLRRVGLYPVMATRHPATLSGGERQRLAIARALAQRPRLLLADEPTSGLDVLTQEHILRLLADLRRDPGLTLVLVTHDLRVARRITDRVITLADGRIVEDLPTDRLADAEHPETRHLLDATPTPS